ncbi:arginine--tRNA ligase [Perlucidibaca piscinae]|uniref:arginine--tRNA ligase n=1 Tax=Perlucidibaca piscinae TaxID=392589 RepID=UPI00047ABD8A|nr:arginine--tRNA ligase [Perlucidibaca piscinae]
MKPVLDALLSSAIATLHQNGVLPADFTPVIQLDRTRDAAHGDWATNLALASAKAAGRKPRDIAEALVAALPADPAVSKVEIAGPGFINFFLSSDSRFAVIRQILDDVTGFCSPNIGQGEKVLLEFVSANPTGPMHVGHGRGAAYGSTLGNLLKATGFDVHREYYINDAGRQADVLAVSVYARYLEACGETVQVPSRAYPADYVKDCAQALMARDGRAWFRPWADVVAGLPEDPEGEGDDIKAGKETYLDAIISRVRDLLGADYRTVQDFGLDTQLAAIRHTLDAFSVDFDQWYSERTLAESGAIDRAVARLRERGHVYEQNGAVWLRTSALGDEKDRVLIRDNGIHTYFAADVAYHLDKLDRGFDTLIDVWGADHHGYIARVRAAIEALTGQGDRFHVALIQFVTLSSGRMGKRSGNFVTLQQLIEEAGNDATRFFYLTRSPEQHLEFDIDLARSQSADNPVYYLQYAHARVASVFRELETRGWAHDQSAGLAALPMLDDSGLDDLLKRLAAWPDAVAAAARQRAPHQLTYALRDLAQAFHGYYNTHKMLIDDAAVRNARLTVSLAVQRVIANGLGLLGVSAPDRM